MKFNLRNMIKKIIQLISLFVMTVILIISCKQKTESGFADVNGTKLYYEISGDGTPMIFLHGFACDHSNWVNQVEYFSKNYKVITYDLRGFGKSQLPDSSLYAHKEDLEAIMDFLGIDQAILIGHSLGGLPAFYFTLDNPDRVISLVLPEGSGLIPSLFSKHQRLFEEIGKASTDAQEHGIDKGKETWLSMTILNPAMNNPLSNDKLIEMTNNYSGWHWVNNDPVKKYKLLNPDDISMISVPTLLMVGELSSSEYYDLVKINSENIKDSKKVIINNSGHMLNIENPEQFNKELELFLSENNIK